MGDANLNENIAERTQVADDVLGHNDQDGYEGDHALPAQEVHLDQARWWFASAAFPMIAGTLGPVASAFSICALVESWRQHLVPGADITKAVFIDDPSWLLAINAIQLAIAIIANLFLLLNMTKRVRFSIAQPITIVGWYISSILLIALCGTASGPLIRQPKIEYVWSQAFYYGLFAAVLYFIVASLMVITIWGAQAGHYPHDFELTASQRTLMLQTILFLMYLLIGALIFSHIEGWLYLDAVYWADVTLFTVGLGDVSLQTKLGRGLMIPYALIGITTLGLVIGSIRSLMLDRGKSRLDARVLEKKRRQLVRRLMRSSKGKVLEPITEKDAGYYPDLKNQPLQNPAKAELERRHNEFHLMRKIQVQASTKRRWMAMAVSTSTWAVLWLVGAKVFQECEASYQDWSYFDGVYFSFQAMTTIGYGDITPVSNAAKAFFVFWSLLALPTLTVLISNAGDTVVKGIRDATVLLGNITILPGERGYKMDIKHFLSRLSFGLLFTEVEIHESPPGFLGAAQPHSDGDEEDEEESIDDVDDRSCSPKDQDNDEEKARTEPRVPRDSSSEQSKGVNIRNGALSKLKAIKHKTMRFEKRRIESLDGKGIPDEFPKTRAEYRLVLIDEIRRVSQHLQRTPPREYTYQEWAWFLRLIGEDESDASTHRQPTKTPRPDGNGQAHQPTQGPGIDASTIGDRRQQAKPQWSWVGHLSPLMDTRDEAQWILDKLSQTLRQELLEAVEEGEGGDGVRSAEEMEERWN